MRSLFTSTLLLASALAFAGCAVSDKTADDGSGDTTESKDALSSLSKSLVGSYDYSAAGTNANFYTTLVLGADLSYAADTRPICTPGMACPMWIRHEEGTWKATGSHGGSLFLKTSLGDTKTFGVLVSGTDLRLTQGSGVEHMTRRAKIGEHCGGNMANARQCEAGVVCFGGPLVGDVGGTCMKPVGEGGSCGFRTQNAPCADGLECSHVSGPLDALTCNAPAPTCASGQHSCPAYQDASGTCHPAYCIFMGAMCVTGPKC